MDDQRSTETIDILTLSVTVDPVGTVLLNGNRVSEVGARRDGALSNHGRTIHLGIACLEQTVRMQGSRLVDLVNDIDHQGVIEVDMDGWDTVQAPKSVGAKQSRSVDEIKRSAHTQFAVQKEATEQGANTYGYCPLTPTTRRSLRPSGLALT